jgi:CNT family concentrative nucleoside transporter
MPFNTAIIGIPVLLAIAFVCSEAKRAISFRVVLAALLLQAAIAAFALYLPFGKAVLAGAVHGVQGFIDLANAGIVFLFGDLATDKVGFIFAFRVLPVIVFVSSLVSTLYYLRIMQLLVTVIGGAISLVIGITKIESLYAAAHIFVGPVEAALTIRPYLLHLTRSQLFALMTVGLSAVSGAILIGYSGLGVRLDYLIAAAFMAPIGGLVMAKILVPEKDKAAAVTAAEIDPAAFDMDGRPANVVEAAANGAAAGLMLAANVGAMLLAFIALVSVLNGVLSGIGGLFGFPGLKLEWILGWLFSPLAFLLGIPWGPETFTTANLVGQKTVLNEFVAFAKFVTIKDSLSAHTQAVITFALCGFANLNALAIVFGGLGGLVPERKHEIAKLGWLAILGGGLANLMSAALASLLLAS